MSDIEILEGGNFSPVVYRDRDVVYKTSHDSTPAVGLLLQHLHADEPELVPEFLGVDDTGLQRLRFIPGELLATSGSVSRERLKLLGVSIRRLHDSLAAYRPASNYAFHPSFPSQTAEMLCHNDLAPWNCVVRGDGTFCFIDWDGVGWGTRAWDLGYALKTFVGLEMGNEARLDGERMTEFLVGYGWDGPVVNVLDQVLERTRAMRDLLASGKQTGQLPWARLYDEGHWLYWSESTEYIASSLEFWKGQMMSSFEPQGRPSV